MLTTPTEADKLGRATSKGEEMAKDITDEQEAKDAHERSTPIKPALVA
ncbi:MAG TPA: hypothetical protein VKT25_04310 [Ktedonobacteraceae bacterium]|nr:hypothetical protein [Ktedonobacteraceae bacterium]